MKKARQEQIKTQLQKILQQGKKAFRKKKYNRSLELLQKGLKLDPGKKYEVTRTIEEQVKRVRKSMRKLADRHVRRAKKEQSSEHPIKALHYYELAQNILPGDEKIKSLYQAQLKANQNSAFNLYNEAIAYASLGGVDEAKTALRQAKKLAKGNKELYQKIKKKLNSLAKE
jgi:tetratricopeptide (TPR) repeat protein